MFCPCMFSRKRPREDEQEFDENLTDDCTAALHTDTERTILAVKGDNLHSTMIRDSNENDVSKKFMDLDLSEVEKADSEKSEKSANGKRRTRTVTPASSHRSVASSPGTVTSWMEREIQSAGKIRDGQLGRKLSGSNRDITVRDQRILAALVKKEEDDRRLEKIRRLAHVAWEESQERTRRRQDRQALERQARLTDLNRTRSKIRGEKEVEREKEISERLRRKREKSEEKESKWERCSEKIHDQTVRQLVEKRQKELERKKGQEERKGTREKLMQNYQQLVNQYQMTALERATLKKEEQLQNKTVRIAEKNRTVKEKQQEHLAQVEKEKKIMEESMRLSMAERHHKAEENLGNLENQRQRQIEEKRMTEEERLKRSKSAVERRNIVMAKYHSDLSQYQKLREEQAEDIYNRSIEKKKQRAAEERSKREELQKKNLNKVKELEKERQRHVLDSIELKDIRSQRVLEEKENAAQQLRTLAYNSQVLRDEFRDRYDKDSFDKKCQKVELDVRMGLGGI